MKQIEPEHWEIDEHGRKFRRVGRAAIEYAPTITTSYGEFEVGNAPPVQKITEDNRPKPGDCPLLSKCTQKCARYGEHGCGLVTGEAPSIGGRCPFGSKQTPFMCSEKCALWNLCNRKENKND